jgi:toxin-antitoxin system PIN domain toxin
VILVDANLLLYAINRDLPQHAHARAWWNQTLSGQKPVLLAWVVILAFLRISTSPRVFDRPLEIEVASAYVSEWLAIPAVRLVAPGVGHWSIFRQLVAQTGTNGNLTTDAHLAALAIERGASLYSADHDFKRFPGLVHVNPLDLKKTSRAG